MAISAADGDRHRLRGSPSPRPRRPRRSRRTRPRPRAPCACAGRASGRQGRGKGGARSASVLLVVSPVPLGLSRWAGVRGGCAPRRGGGAQRLFSPLLTLGARSMSFCMCLAAEEERAEPSVDPDDRSPNGREPAAPPADAAVEPVPRVVAEDDAEDELDLHGAVAAVLAAHGFRRRFMCRLHSKRARGDTILPGSIRAAPRARWRPG